MARPADGGMSVATSHQPRLGEPDPIRFSGGCLSNFHHSPFQAPHPFTGAPTTFDTVEHYFQAHKAADRAGFDRVAASDEPRDAKRAGRTVALRGDWEQLKVAVMLDGLRRKFADPALRLRLVLTGTAVLQEDSKHDFEWGARDREGGWDGGNLLGLCLMQIRRELHATWTHNRSRLTAGLTHFGVTELCHIASAHELPQIARDGALLSAFQQGSMHGSVAGHGHGNKDGFTRGFVCLSYRPAWYLCTKPQVPELAILVIDAATAVHQAGATFSPANSAGAAVSEAALRSGDNLAPRVDERFAACFTSKRPNDQAEVLVPDELPLSAVKRVIFCDAEAMEHWWPKTQNATATRPLPNVAVSTSGEPISFPRDFVPAQRRRP